MRTRNRLSISALRSRITDGGLLSDEPVSAAWPAPEEDENEENLDDLKARRIDAPADLRSDTSGTVRVSVPLQAPNHDRDHIPGPPCSLYFDLQIQ